jgi:hypothetical protein
MLRQIVFHDFSNRPSASRLITISAFAAACVAMFVIPWIFPRTQPVLGESYALGFNNRLAVIGLCLVIVAAAFARLFSASAADDARETLAWFAGDGWQAIRRTTKLELAILGLFCFFMTQFILWWDGMLVIPYWGEADYFLSRIDLVALGHRPYVDFHHNYGPLMLYAPLWLDWATGGGLGFETAYAWTVAAWTILGAACLFYFLSMLSLPSWTRPWVFGLGLIVWIPLTMGLNYTPLRFTVVPAALMAFHTLVGRSKGKSEWPIVPLIGSASAVMAAFMISPEIGLASTAAILAYAATVALRADWTGFTAIVVGVAVACGITHYSFPGYFHGLKAFAAGANNFPIYPNIQNLLLAGVATFVVSRLASAAYVASDDGRAPLSAGIAAASIVLLSPSLGRCDPGHVIVNSLMLFCLLFPASAIQGRRQHLTWIVIFGVALVAFPQLSYWSHYRGNYSSAFAVKTFYRENPVAVQDWRRAWETHRTHSPHAAKLNWKRPAPFPGWADQPEIRQGSMAAPLAADIGLDRFVKLLREYKPPYHPTPKPEILTPVDAQRASADALRNDLIVLPESYAAASQSDSPIDKKSYERQIGEFLSWLMVYPVRCTMQRQPFTPEVDVAKAVLAQGEVLGQGAGVVVVRPTKHR